jgi:hypothetical protein
VGVFGPFGSAQAKGIALRSDKIWTLWGDTTITLLIFVSLPALMVSGECTFSQCVETR